MKDAANASPSEWEMDVLLTDGTPVHVRPIHPSDAPALVTFHAKLSADTVYRRYFAAHPHLSAAEAEHFAVVDYARRFALVATEGEELIGVARYEQTERPEVAEVAFVVADAYQGRGIGSLLLEHLAGAARERGVRRFVADTLFGNGPMLGVFRDAGFEQATSVSDGIVRVEFPIAETPRSLLAAEERERRADVASMRRLLGAQTVAVIGASRREGAIGHAIFSNLLSGRFAGTVYPVNPSARSVLGVQAFPSVSSVPEVVDLAVVAVPAQAVLPVVAECGRAGVKSVVVISAGFSEAGEAGRARQAELVATARRHGMRLVGPNCLGLANMAPDVTMNATFVRSPLAPGRVGLYSQSGALGIAVIEAAKEVGLGISSFVSVGNKADVSGNDLLCYWEADPSTAVVLLYLESFGNPRKFARIARRVSRSKPIVALKAGSTETGARAARSHTAAAASPERATEAVFGQAGVIRVATMGEMLEVALVLDSQPVPLGERLAIVGNSGGPGILAADACAAAGLTLAELGPQTRSTLASFLPEEASFDNPVDMISAASAQDYGRTLDAVLADDAVDAVVVIVTPLLAVRDDEVAAAIVASSDRVPRKPVVAVVLDGSATPRLLARPASRSRVPAFGFPEQAVRALGRAARYGRWLLTPPGTLPELGGLDVPAARAVARRTLDRAPSEGRWMGANEVADLCEAVGVHVLPSRYAATVGEAARAASQLGFPVALKAGSPEIVHKSDAGAVVLGLASEGAVREAFLAMSARLGGDVMGGAILQPMARSGVETIVGLVQDPGFGPLVAFGLGGVSTDLLGDVSFRFVPLTDRDASDLIGSVRAAPLLTGYRGQPATDVLALEDLLLRVSVLAAEVPEVCELDFNPVVAHVEGLSIVDAKIRLRQPAPGPGPLARALRPCGC